MRMGEHRIRLLKFLTNINIDGTERQFVQLAQKIDPPRFDRRIRCFDRFGSFLTAIEARNEFEIPDDAPILLVVSRLNALKGIPNLLEAMPSVLAQFPKARLLIVGDGARRPTLESHTEALGLKRAVIFTGFQLDVPSLLRETSISALPSLREALSNVLIESMAAGILVVATQVGGNPGGIRNGVTEFLVPAKNSAELSRAILQLLDGPVMAKSMGKAGMLHIRQRFSIDSALHETEQPYTSMLQNARQPSLREEWT